MDPQLWWRLPAALITAMLIGGPIGILGIWLGSKVGWILFLAGRP